ncbi:type II toxin-antitoxin system RelB/DinJ family antitoxin [Adlercreutzia murintestinalis]|jgi:addiction module antitoxin, RelB/DinJ family|uniref:type II toxin-antitoxin system RelB/DinJ family antitoxin n=1 Tax=Adlercreutzia murintestinalis TaxID=2941325 RepID=UPI00203A9B48|nr:type II toxin-antitoxin system RelB/DinJ family antitoxin [Adlercreutzia murintestinalis]
MAACSLTIRLDSELKEEAARVMEHYGLDLSSAIRMFLTQTVSTYSIPLSLDYASVSHGQPNEETLAAMREADEIIARGAPGYSSAEEMFTAMGL